MPLDACSLHCIAHVSVPLGSIRSDARPIDQYLKCKCTRADITAVPWLLGMLTLMSTKWKLQAEQGKHQSPLFMLFCTGDKGYMVTLCHHNPNAICRGTREDECHEPSL